jgi:hypothetical protein
MDVTQANLSLDAGLYAFDKAKDVKSQEILGALGMTPETQKAQKEIDESMKQAVASAIGQGMGFDIKA